MDDTSSATKADVQRLEQAMNEQFSKVNEQFKKVHEDIDRVLDVLVNVDKKLTKKTNDHEQRIARLEEVVVV
ncbi:hypothetical protein HYZ98_00335 [Candidatus Peregrinibacteria bacterium]|nr:hypothetical protein [Candidatus Peregrinibacteria bacterium]